jgi:hypothetical protein
LKRCPIDGGPMRKNVYIWTRHGVGENYASVQTWYVCEGCGAQQTADSVKGAVLLFGPESGRVRVLTDGTATNGR